MNRRRLTPRLSGKRPAEKRYGRRYGRSREKDSEKLAFCTVPCVTMELKTVHFNDVLLTKGRITVTNLTTVGRSRRFTPVRIEPTTQRRSSEELGRRVSRAAQGSRELETRACCEYALRTVLAYQYWAGPRWQICCHRMRPPFPAK